MHPARALATRCGRPAPKRQAIPPISSRAMSKPVTDPIAAVSNSPAVQAAARALVDAVQRAIGESPLSAEGYAEAMQQIAELRGRPLFLPIVLSGLGDGARLRLADGAHDPRLHRRHRRLRVRPQRSRSARDGRGRRRARRRVPGTPRAGPRVARGCCDCCCEHASPRLRARLALRLGRDGERERAQDDLAEASPRATLIVAFENAFAGRTTTMAELTDKPSFREGLPLRGNVLLRAVLRSARRRRNAALAGCARRAPRSATRARSPACCSSSCRAKAASTPRRASSSSR